jgi:small subunit ribosomal protein S2
MGQIDKMKGDGTWDTLSKREKLFKERQKAKLEKNLGTIADMTRLPAAVFVVDITKEHIAVAEAQKLGIPVFGMVDTNSDPSVCAFPIPSNDDASKSISKVMEHICGAVVRGLDDRRNEREKRAADAPAPAAAEAPAEESKES